MGLISLCMIVKDEEKVLDRCLSSVKDYVDEIIIVDTGSTDSTKTIARQYTDKVYDFKWINDFSAARNHAIKYATCKWIFILDADEYLDQPDAQKMRDFFQNELLSDHTIYSVSILSFLGHNHSISTNEALVGRAFPNHKGFHYERPIHEQIVSANGRPLRSTALPFRAFHSGYMEETLSAKKKHDRNLAIFTNMKKKAELSSYDNLMLGNQYVMMGKYDEALKFLQKALKKEKELGAAYKQVLFSIINIYMNTGKFIEAWNFMDKYLVAYQSYPDILALRGLVLYHLGFIDKSKEVLLQCIRMAEALADSNKPFSVTSPDMGVKLPLKYLSIIYEQKKDFSNTVYYLTKLLSAFKDGDSLSRLIRILLQNGDVPSIAAFIDRLLNTGNNQLIPALICTISISLGHAGLAEYYYNRLEYDSVLSLSDRLRYALIMKNHKDFKRYWIESNTDEQQQPNVIHHVAIAVIAWNQYEWLDWLQLDADNTSASYINWINQLLAGELKEDTDSDQAHAFTLLSGLYTTNNLESFDRILENVHSPKVINQIANMLYVSHHDDAAFQCYSYLNEQKQLDVNSCSNIASYYLHEQRFDDAAILLEQAIAQQPDRKNLYIQYCTASQEPVKKSAMKQKLLEIDPQYNSFSPFCEL